MNLVINCIRSLRFIFDISYLLYRVCICMYMCIYINLSFIGSDGQNVENIFCFLDICIIVLEILLTSFCGDRPFLVNVLKLHAQDLSSNQVEEGRSPP